MVIWTTRARADLKAIHEYIAHDSTQNAKKIVQGITSKVETLMIIPIDQLSQSTITQRVFLHFLGIHYLNERGIQRIYKVIYNEADLATRFCILCSDNIFVTAASYIESPLCFRIMKNFSMLFDYGYISLVGGSDNLEEFFDNKIKQYSVNSYQKNSYYNTLLSQIPSYISKPTSTTENIIVEWSDILHKGEVYKEFETMRYRPPLELEKRWEMVPQILEGRAFIVDNVAPILFDKKPNLHEINTLHRLINIAYFNSFTKDLKSGIVCDLISLAPWYIIPSYDKNISYKTILQKAQRKKDLIEKIKIASSEELLEIKATQEWLDVLRDVDAEAQQNKETYLQYMSGRFVMNSVLNRQCVAIFIALDEEFRQFIDIIRKNNLTPKVIDDIGGYIYQFNISHNKTGSNIEVVVKLIGDMGPEISSSAASNLFSKYTPTLAISIGIAASLSSDIKLCDVIIATQIDSYGSNIKTVTRKGAKNTFDLAHRGTVYRANHSLIEAIANFEFMYADDYNDWQNECSLDFKTQQQNVSNLVDYEKYITPDVHRVHLASGPVLGASTPFKEWLQKRDQTIKALEMESASIASIAANRDNPIQFLSVRGISDYGDESKANLDEYSKKIYRSIAMRNATRYLIYLIKCTDIVTNE